MVDVMKFFGIPIAQFRKEWAELTDKDKEQIKQGIEDGTLSY